MLAAQYEEVPQTADIMYVRPEVNNTPGILQTHSASCAPNIVAPTLDARLSVLNKLFLKTFRPDTTTTTKDEE